MTDQNRLYCASGRRTTQRGIWLPLALLVLGLFLMPPSLQARTDPPVLLSDLNIPLLAGFREQEDSRVVFDTPDGRIIEVQASGALPAQQVFDYYQLVLASLAWRVVNETGAESGLRDRRHCAARASHCIVAQREAEILSINIWNADRAGGAPESRTIVYFALDPK